MFSVLTDEGTAFPYSRVPDFQRRLDWFGPFISAGRCTCLAHMVGLFMGRNGACNILHHLRYQHGSLCLLCPYKTSKSQKLAAYLSTFFFFKNKTKFSLFHQDYVYPEAKDRQFLRYFYKGAIKKNFNVTQYNQLKDELAQVGWGFYMAFSHSHCYTVTLN